MKVDPHAAYVNTRIRAMRSRLYGRPQLEQLFDLQDPAVLVESMTCSPYASDMAEALTRFQGLDAVEEAVSRNLVRTFQRILNLTEGDYRRLAERFLTRWDLAAVKALLRLRRREIDAEEGTGELFPGPTLTVPLQRELAGHETMEALVGGLVTWNPDLCGTLSEQLKAYQESSEIGVLEDALDRRYFVGSVEELGASRDENAQTLCTLLRMEIDRINLRTVLRHAGTEDRRPFATERLLPEGTVTLEQLEQAAGAHGAEQAIEAIKGSAYSDLVERLYPFIESGRLSRFEREFDALLLDALRQEARVHMFSVALFMHYAWLKYNEILNLRIIARGEARHLPIARVREELLYV